MSADIAAGVPIVGFTGVNGAGKTALAVDSAINDMKNGRTVYSTVPIRSEFGHSRPIRSLREMLEYSDATVLLDEVSVIFSSRSSQSLPPEVVSLIQTLRHQNLTVRWTAPAWARCDNLLREVTQGLVNVMPAFRVADGTPWPRPRLMMAALLDTSLGKTDEAPSKVLRRRFYLPKRLDAWGAYDTHADTPMLGRHLQGGICVDCGGSVERPKHSEKRHQEMGIPFFAADIRRPVFEQDDEPETPETALESTANTLHAARTPYPNDGQHIHRVLADQEERYLADLPVPTTGPVFAPRGVEPGA